MKKGIFSVFISIFILIITDACSNNKNSTTESEIEQSEQYIKTQQGTIEDLTRRQRCKPFANFQVCFQLYR